MKLTIEVAGDTKEALKESLQLIYPQIVQGVLINAQWTSDYIFGNSKVGEYKVVLDEDAPNTLDAYIEMDNNGEWDDTDFWNDLPYYHNEVD